LTIVVVDEETDADFVPMIVFAERKGTTNEIGTALTQGIVEALDMGSLASLFADGAMAFGRQQRRVCFPEIAVANRSFAIISWQRGP
jgi:hypothetical protein